MTLKSSELLVERSKVALFLNLLTRCGLTLQHRKDNSVELATELVLIEHLFEVFGNEFGFKLEHATSECAQNEGVMAIEQGDTIDRSNLVMHDLFTFRGKASIIGSIFQIVGLVPRTEVERSQRDDGCLIGFFTKVGIRSTKV